MSNLTAEGQIHAQTEYAAASAKLDAKVAKCGWCKRAQMLNESLNAERIARGLNVSTKRCSKHAMEGRVMYATSPVSEAYWCS